MPDERLELPQGTLDLLILKALSLGPQHGWAITERLHQVSRATLQVPQGSLYPALHPLGRLRQQSTGQVLRAHPHRAPAAQGRDGRLAPAHDRGGPGSWNELRRTDGGHHAARNPE